MKDLLIHSFSQLTACNSKYSLSVAVKDWACKIFGVSTANFLFVENEKFVVYKAEKE